MKRFKELTEELFNEGGGDMMPADEMTMSELKIACFAANNILERLEGGAMIQRWQISAIVKAKEELASVYTSISADEMDMDDMDAYDDMDAEEEPMYIGFEYPSMYGEEVELDEISYRDSGAQNMMRASRKADKEVDKMRAQAAKRAEKEAAKKKPVEEETDLSESYVGRETKDGTWRVFKTGNAVAVAGPFKSAQEAQAWIKKQSMNEAPLLGPQGKIHRAASADQSDREYAAQRSFKDAWTAKNVGKKWPGYSEAGYKHPAYKKEETDYEVDVEGLPKMYVKANSPGEVKTNLRKVVRNPDMIRGVERVAKMTLQKIFRDKASGKEEVSEDLDLEEGYNDPIHRKYISDTVHEFVPKDDPKHDKIVDHLHKAKNYGTKTKDELETATGISVGAAHRITKSVADNMKANFGSPSKPQTQAQRVGAYLKQKQIGPRK